MFNRRSLLQSIALMTATTGAARAAAPAAEASPAPAAPPTLRHLVRGGGVDPAAFADAKASAEPDGRRDNGVAIQRAINTLSDEGGGTVSLRTGFYRFQNLLVIPSNVILEGVSRDATRLERIDTSNTRTILIGTYGPVISTSPKLETRYTIEDALPGQAYVDLVDAADAAAFASGDMVAIDGTLREIPHGEGFWMPNYLTKLTGVEGRRLRLLAPVDGGRQPGSYVTRDGNRPGIRKLNTGKDSRVIDVTGRRWPMFVAENAGIRRITLAQSQRIGWFLPFMAVDNCFMEDCRLIGRGFGGNPVANSRFERLEVRHEAYPMEFAYLAHDTLIKDVTCLQVGDGEWQRSHGTWVNSNEGGKRITFDNLSQHGLEGLKRRPDHAISLFSDSVLKNSRIYAPSSKGALAYRSSIINTTIVSANDERYAVVLSDSRVEGSTIIGGNDVAVMVDSTSQEKGSVILDSTIGEEPRRPSDFILKAKNPEFTVVERTATVLSRRNPVLLDLPPESGPRVASAGAIDTGMEAEVTDIVLGDRNAWQFDLAGTLAGSGRGRFVVRFNEVEQIALPFKGLAGRPFQFVAELTHVPGDGDRLFTYRATLSHGDDAVSRANKVRGVPASRIRTVDLVIVDIRQGDHFERDIGRITVRSVGRRV